MIADYFISFATYCFIYIILVESFNLTLGFTGLANLGHMVFFGIGAYASAILTLNNVFWPFAMALAGLLAAVCGLVIAAITVRLKADYFQVVTLGLLFMAIAVSRNWVSLTRGALGIPGVSGITSSRFYYMLFALAVASISVWFFYWLVNSKTGKIFQAIRDDETAAATLGKNTYAYKVASVSISTFFAGIAGSLFVHFIRFIDPTVFDLGFFAFVISMLIAGGAASIWGAAAGVFVIFFFSEAMSFIHINPSILGAFREIVYLLLVIIILIYRPKGILGKVNL